MQSKLKAGLNETQVEELESSFRSAKVFRNQLSLLLLKEREQLIKKLTSDDTMTSSSWENDVKNILANIRAYEKVEKYLND